MSLGTRVLVVLSLAASVTLAGACSRSAPPRMMTLSEPSATRAADTAFPAGRVASANPSASTSSSSSSNARAPFSPAEYEPIDGLKTVHFHFDRTDVRGEDLVVLDRNAAWMLENKRYLILVEGHADERGTAEYNTTLGDKRAKSTVNYLVSKGVPAGRFTVLSLGEERPLCRESTQGCWARNRRAVFLVKPE